MQVGPDERPVLVAAEAAFRTGGGVQPIVDSVGTGIEDSDVDGRDFYALLYSALYLEAEGNAYDSERYMLRALETSYSRKSRDYMVAVGWVHAQLRGWITQIPDPEVERLKQTPILPGYFKLNGEMGV